jgi:predicted O-methyltransferase YrrM
MHRWIDQRERENIMDFLIVWLRRQRAMGRGTRIINAMMNGRQYMKDVIDYTRRGKMRDALLHLHAETPEALVDFAFNAGDGFLRPMQNTHEITELLRMVQTRKPKRVLEIGTAKGGTLFLLTRAAADDALIVSVDLPFGINGGGYPDWKGEIYHKFAKPAQTLTLMRANSHLAGTRDKVKAIIGDEGFDVIMIDADHSYEGAKADYDLYSPLAAAGGLVVLHDVLVNRFDAEINVAPLWKELKAKHGTAAKEIVDHPEQGNFGIGVIEAP